MDFFRTLFGPSREEVWRQLSAEIGAHYQEGGWFRNDKVQARVGDWIVTLDTYTVSNGKTSTTYTRIRAPFINRDGFRFTLYRAGFFTELGKLFGMQDIEVGDPLFDRDFVVQSANPPRVRALLSTDRIRSLVARQPAFFLTIKDDEGWFGASFPQGVDELYFQVTGEITDVDLLRWLYELFAEVLAELSAHDSAYADELSVNIQALHSPGGRIVSEDTLLWDGDSRRRHAAFRLGELKDPRAVPAVLAALNDRDPVVRTYCIRALGELGDATAVPHLLPLLGAAIPPPDEVQEALRKLGAGPLVDAVADMLRGDPQARRYLVEGRQPGLVPALIGLLAQCGPTPATHLAGTLAELGALEARPAVKEVLRRHGSSEPWVKLALQDALDRLEMHASLPRPGVPTAPDTASLPRPTT